MGKAAVAGLPASVCAWMASYIKIVPLSFNPFAEVNWLRTNDDISVTFLIIMLTFRWIYQQIAPELKAGIEVNLNNQWSV